MRSEGRWASRLGIRAQTVYIKALIFIFLFGIASVASAGTLTYTLNQDGCSSGCGTSPFGTVTLTQTGSNVNVTATLLNGDEFVRTGAGESLVFEVSGNPAITITNLTSGFTNNGPASASTFGSFEYSIRCTGCGNGASSPLPGPLSFTAALTGGGTLSISDFIANGSGHFFASDILGDNNKTGNVGSSGPGVRGDGGGGSSSSAPEPPSLGLIGGSLLGLGLIGR